MKNNKYLYLIIIILVLIVGWLFINNKKSPMVETQPVKEIKKGNCLGDDCLLVSDLDYPVGELTDEAKSALNLALNDEYKALTTYNEIINKFGSVRPFIMIKGAEEQHIASLKTLFDKYGLEIPKNDWLGKISIPGTIQESCRLGVEAEIDNANLYKGELLPKVNNYEDIILVFTNLMRASEDKHLPAFEKCSN